MRGWHWISHDRKLRYQDGREVVDGETLSVEVTARLCERGLHASERINHSVRYAGLVNWSPDGYAWLCSVQLGADAQRGDDKAVSTSRTCVASKRVHISVLVEYAGWSARYAADAADAADAARYAAAAADAARYAADAEEFGRKADEWWSNTWAALQTDGRIP